MRWCGEPHLQHLGWLAAKASTRVTHDFDFYVVWRARYVRRNASTASTRRWSSRRRRQAELGEDARHVLLDRAQGDEESLRDRLVRPALRHQLEHLALARGQLLQRVVGALATDKLADDGGVERRASVGHAAHGRAELLEIGDAVLEEIADTLGARLEERHRVAGLDVLREQEHADRRMPLADLAGGPQPFVCMRRRHANVDDRDVGLVHRDVAEQVLRVPRLRDDLEPRFLEQPRHAFPEEDRVVCDNDPASIAELRNRPTKRREVARAARRPAPGGCARDREGPGVGACRDLSSRPPWRTAQLSTRAGPGRRARPRQYETRG